VDGIDVISVNVELVDEEKIDSSVIMPVNGTMQQLLRLPPAP
jgi:hypothetical protein